MFGSLKKFFKTDANDGKSEQSDEYDSDAAADANSGQIRVVTVGEINNADISSTCAKCRKNTQPYAFEDETEVFKVKLKDSQKHLEPGTDDKDKLTDTQGEMENIRLDRSMTVLSPENLCVDCEIQRHPERFHGCAFCRRPLRYLFACTSCRLGFAEWVKETIQSDTIALSRIKKQAKAIVAGIIRSGFIENREFIYRTDKIEYFEWPGFYAGPINVTEDGESIVYLPTWIIPSMLIINHEDANIGITDLKDFSMFEKALLRILESNNIFIYNNVQIDITTFDKSNIHKISPYAI